MASAMPSMANALMGAGAPANGNALMPNAGPMGRLPPPAPPPPDPYAGVHPDFHPQPVPVEEQISARVPVPKADFHEKHHKHLHDNVLGEHFDDPGAAAAIRDLYAIVRKSRPHVHPRHVLEAARDAWFAAHHGFMPHEMAGASVGHHAERRHHAAGGRHPEHEDDMP